MRTLASELARLMVAAVCSCCKIERAGSWSSRPGETDREQPQHRAPGRLDQRELAELTGRSWLSRMRLPQCPGCGRIRSVPTVQSPREIDDLLAGQLVGRSIRQLQVLGVNSLKTVTPSTDALVGKQVRRARCEDRVIVILTTSHKIRIDLQRTGRVSCLVSADVWQVSSGVPLPSIRLLLDDGTGVDFTEPAKTKRITISLLPGSA